MIVLKSTDELRKVFGKLIGTLSVPVEWDGNFVVMDNFLVLSALFLILPRIVVTRAVI